MRTPTKPTILIVTLFLFLFSWSCNKEELFIEPSEEVVEETDEELPEDPSAVDPSLPCEFSLNSIDSNSSVVINCSLDLGGEVVNLPDNINILYEGGEIKNGTLVFSGGTIAGDLLNISLEISGNVSLRNTTFGFDPKKWDIVEGKTTKEISLQNRKNINKAIELVNGIGANVFELNKIDAYFNVEANKANRKYSWDRSIRIPSNFHFKMSDETYLRVQPTHFPAYALITTMVTDDALISGGNLIGDRWEHDYTPINDIAGVNRDEHGYGHLIWVIGSHNTVLDGITIKDAIGEGIQVHSETIRDPDGSLKPGTRTSENILIKNCFISECRRNNIAIIDAKGVIIENCEINDTGKGEQAYDTNGNKIFSSSGTAPRYGIDLEALRYVNDDGTINEINKIDDVIIRNCSFKGNAAGDIDIYTVTNVLIENNYFDKWVANFAANDAIIRNNTFEARSPDISFAINIQSFIRNNIEFNYNYTITGNTIKGYRDGIKLSGYNQIVKNNIIEDCVTGLQLGMSLSDSEISGNKYISTLDVSYGINPMPNASINNVTISNEYIEVTNRPLNLRSLNSGSTLTTNQLTIDNCEFKTSSKNFPLYINNSKNITVKNSTSNTDFEVIDSQNINLTNNSVTQ
ncbi:right-handed parallel beta-helix repeat-containing protein [Hwangdonia seohaensis]|uniref:Right-handed parallel beta-helix repeat-containing protein n=1 Tax=Hwangdonia seohaensis TaxID=1240727 RepID=A0ABW3RB31_9FLAO|nr:right-handed parallel beta-helix repeat-containing protein [Hwangdonia seohaensis]